MKTIIINWTEPMRFHEAIKAKESAKRGLYQITSTGKQPIFYVGMVQSPHRTFRQRMKEHAAGLLSGIHLQVVRVRFGLLKAPGYKVTKRLIKEVEGAVIFDIRPGNNQRGMNGYQLREDVEIRSEGDRGLVPAIIQTSDHPSL